jgi:hypothetical protein
VWKEVTTGADHLPIIDHAPGHHPRCGFTAGTMRRRLQGSTGAECGSSCLLNVPFRLILPQSKPGGVLTTASSRRPSSSASLSARPSDNISRLLKG